MPPQSDRLNVQFIVLCVMDDGRIVAVKDSDTRKIMAFTDQKLALHNANLFAKKNDEIYTVVPAIMPTS